MKPIEKGYCFHCYITVVKGGMTCPLCGTRMPNTLAEKMEKKIKQDEILNAFTATKFLEERLREREKMNEKESGKMGV